MMKKKSPIKIIIIIVLVCIVIGIAGFIWYKNGTRRAIKGLDDPIQEPAEGSVILEASGYNFVTTFLYSYDIDALVVHTKDYYGNSVEDQLSHKDLALAWGAVAEYNEFIDFHWHQEGRFYSYKVDTRKELDNVGGIKGISQHSSNNHIISADGGVESQIRAIRRGDHVRLKGYLVNLDGIASGGKSYHWHTSTTRNDTGNHSCEVFYVTEVTWLD